MDILSTMTRLPFYEGIRSVMRLKPKILIFIVLMILCTACRPISPVTNATPTPKPTIKPAPRFAQTFTPDPALDTCPAPLKNNPNCYTPHALRVAYGVEALTAQGFTGKGQTIIDIVSYGSPTLQHDMDGWAVGTELDVEIMHAIAPDAGIVVLTSPVDETEGIIGLPEFLQLEQYAVSHHLGQIFSQSYVASEVTLSDSKGQQLVKTYTDFYKQITTQQGFTVVSGSGDNGATDWANLNATQLSPTATVNFPADVPWVTAVGGTTLLRNNTDYDETAWSRSGGGVSN